jgi:hypothetical protein
MAKKSEKSKEKLQPVDVHFIKTANYRTYYFDGAFGGLTPKGAIYLDLYLERAATPQSMKMDLGTGSPSEVPDTRHGKSGIVREIECGLIMDIQAASALRDWLNRKLDQYVELMTDEDPENEDLI